MCKACYFLKEIQFPIGIPKRRLIPLKQIRQLLNVQGMVLINLRLTRIRNLGQINRIPHNCIQRRFPHRENGEEPSSPREKDGDFVFFEEGQAGFAAPGHGVVEVGFSKQVADGDGVTVLEGIFDEALAFEDVDVFFLVFHEEDLFGAAHLGKGGRESETNMLYCGVSHK